MATLLETARLILRPFERGDFDAVHAYASNIENVKYMDWGPNSEDDTRAFISLAIEKAAKVPRVHYDFAVTLKDGGKLIGGGGIYLQDKQRQAYLGWILHMDYWKRGYGAEFAAELLRFGFEDLNLHRIYAFCNTENYGSYRVMERAGMRREAEYKRSRFGRPGVDEYWLDEYVYAILADEWKKNNL